MKAQNTREYLGKSKLGSTLLKMMELKNSVSSKLAEERLFEALNLLKENLLRK